MAKKKSRIKEVVERVESWVGMGPKARKKTAEKTAAKKSPPKTAKKGKKVVTKKRKKST